MTYDQTRRWLALYFLLVSSFLAAYILIGAESPLLPISRENASAGVEIIIPVLIGQVTIVFQWIANIERNDPRPCPIPAWAIVAPPTILLVVILAAIVVMITGNHFSGGGWGLSGEAFNSVLALVVSILNASTVFLVARLFPRPAARVD
jgi:hypothetical protein